MYAYKESKLLDEQHGCQSWWRGDQRHREGGPAWIDPNGSQIWYYNGVPHRGDGPAVTTSNGKFAWYLNGIQYMDPLVYWLAAAEWKKNMNVHTDLEGTK